MKAFRFHLDRVLAWRATELRAAEERLAQLQHQLLALSRQEAQLLADYYDNAGRLMSSPTIVGSELTALGVFRERTGRMHQALRAQRAQCEAHIAEQRQKLLKARKDYRILEKLKERRRRNWVYLNDREVESIAAEAHLVNWIRESREQGTTT